MHPLVLHRKETPNCLAYGCVNMSWLFRKAVRGGSISFWLGACMHIHSIHSCTQHATVHADGPCAMGEEFMPNTHEGAKQACKAGSG